MTKKQTWVDLTTILLNLNQNQINYQQQSCET